MKGIVFLAVGILLTTGCGSEEAAPEAPVAAEGEAAAAAPADATPPAEPKAAPSTEPAWTCASMCVESWNCTTDVPATWVWKYKAGRGANAAEAFFDLRAKCDFNLWDNFWCDGAKPSPSPASIATSCGATD